MKKFMVFVATLTLCSTAFAIDDFVPEYCTIDLYSIVGGGGGLVTIDSVCKGEYKRSSAFRVKTSNGKKYFYTISSVKNTAGGGKDYTIRLSLASAPSVVKLTIGRSGRKFLDGTFNEGSFQGIEGQ